MFPLFNDVTGKIFVLTSGSMITIDKNELCPSIDGPNPPAVFTVTLRLTGHEEELFHAAFETCEIFMTHLFCAMRDFRGAKLTELIELTRDQEENAQ